MPVSDVGKRVVEFIRQRLQVDPEWYHPRDRGFSWWPGALAQHVWAEPPYEDDGITLARIHVRADVLRRVPDGDALGALAPVMEAADLSGLVWSGEDGAIQFASSFYVYEQVEGGLGLVVALAAALQAAEVFEQEFTPSTPPAMERLLALDDAEFRALIDKLPPGAEREEMVKLMTALRAARP
jgi:hypothetical protein